jgi:membrane protein YdbS with pleckstrin-like domain
MKSVTASAVVGDVRVIILVPKLWRVRSCPEAIREQLMKLKFGESIRTHRRE